MEAPLIELIEIYFTTVSTPCYDPNFKCEFDTVKDAIDKMIGCANLDLKYIEFLGSCLGEIHTRKIEEYIKNK